MVTLREVAILGSVSTLPLLDEGTDEISCFVRALPFKERGNGLSWMNWR